MRYTKIQSQRLLSSGEDFNISVLTYLGMAATLFNGAERFEQIFNIFKTEGPRWNLMKTVQAVSEKTFKLTILYMYRAQGQGQITTKILIVAKQFYCSNHKL